MASKRGGGEEESCTVVTPQNEVEDRLQPEEAEEIPADTRHPSGVHVFRVDAGLKHAFELDGQGEG